MLDLSSDLNLVLRLMGIALFGTLGLCVAGTLVAAIASELEGGEALLVALLMPLLFPIVISSAKLSSFVLEKGNIAGKWVLLNVGYIAIFLIISVLLFEEVIE
jgi:ABC-type transport system involved in cytochrome c biogenesis permease component